MSPLEIEILLHYNCRAVDYREGDFTASAVRRAIDWFKSSARLLETDKSGCARTYKLTPKGEFYVEALCSMPLPVEKYEIPPFEVETNQ